MNMSKSRDIQVKNAITEGDGILACNCEGTEQLCIKLKSTFIWHRNIAVWECFYRICRVQSIIFL